MNRTTGAILAWLAVATTATVATSLAVGAIGTGIVPQAEPPLSPDEVNRRLAEPATGTSRPPVPTTTTTPTTTTGNSSTPPPGDPPTVLSSQGGIVYARCEPGVDIVSASPAQGYRVKDIEPEDGGQRVRFESGRVRIEVTVTCASGTPRASVRVN
ncbi:MAG TPA: hypothetical protein VFV67_02225 [Actinophytocola sp.]|uniref:hypothetical protein n=1 Tax=Actinophytocola sp. TaxID=1872138 RepID=UPI002DBA7801|nr:hypothetical protein [Actinophytocola sp.]HEU5469442.1 hypothetical protein [Actinophytocola sp.]